MSEGTIAHDVAARLLKLTPGELEELVSRGVIPRQGRDKYVLALVVHSYIDHLRQIGSKDEVLGQVDLASRLDMSDRNLREVLRVLDIDSKTTPWLQILKGYIRKLRDEAAGRSEKELAAIRGRKELAQAMREELAFASDLKMVILKDDIRPGLIGILKEIQTSVLQTARRSAQAIQSEHKIKLHDGILLEPLRTALRDIGTSADQLVATIEGKPSGAVSSAIAADQGLDRTELPASGRE
jgi:hypothetical protein